MEIREVILKAISADSRWLLIDLKDIVVHLFVREERQVYQLDRLYADVPVETYDL